MQLNPNAKIPPVESLYFSIAGVVRERKESKCRNDKRRLKRIAKELSFIIEQL